MDAPGKYNGQIFYLRLWPFPYKKGDLIKTSEGVKLIVLKTYKSWWWRFLRWLGFKVKSPNIVKVRY